MWQTACASDDQLEGEQVLLAPPGAQQQPLRVATAGNGDAKAAASGAGGFHTSPAAEQPPAWPASQWAHAEQPPLNGWSSSSGDSGQNGGMDHLAQALSNVQVSESPAVESSSNADAGSSKPARRLLLVLDLNGLLAHRVQHKKASKEQKATVGKPGGPFSAKGYYAWIRPGTEQFTKFLFENFDVLVWSSARIENVQFLVDMTMKAHDRKLRNKLCQEQCGKAGRHPNEPKPLFIKNLAEVWKVCPDHDQFSTLLVDDSLYKAVLNPPNTAIHPKEWQSTNTSDRSLFPGGAMRDYLERLLAASRQPDFTGVPDFVAANPFDSGHTDGELEVERRIEQAARNFLKV